MTSGILPCSRRPRIEASPMLKAIGTLIATKAMKAKLRIIPITYPKNSKRKYRTSKQLKYLPASPPKGRVI
jgi:hypothetical protein